MPGASFSGRAALAASAAEGWGLELLAPKGLWLLTLLIPLVILYLLKIRRQRRVVASTWLWATAPRDLMARSPFKRFMVQVPLILQALALIALAIALGRPAARGRELLGDHVALVVDVSASMSAEGTGVAPRGDVTRRTSADPGGEASGTGNADPQSARKGTADADPRPAGKTRLDLAKDAAKSIVSTLPPGSDVLVLEAGRDARIASPRGRDPHRTKAAIDRLTGHDVEGDLGAAIALAVDRLRQLGGSRRIVVLTDGSLARKGSLLGATLPIDVVTVGAEIDNAAIVRVDVQSGRVSAEEGAPSLSEPRGFRREQVQAFLVVANYGKQPRELYVTMRQDNATDVLASRRVLIAPGERQPVVLTFHPAPGDYRKGLLFDIAPHDAMPVDDVAYARVPAGDKLPVYLASASAELPASAWIERALVSDPSVEVKAGTVASLLGSTSIGLDTFVVVDGACPVDPPGGDLLIVNPPPGKCYGAMVGASVEHPIVTSWENGDPRMRFLTLDGVHIAKAHLVKPDGATQELIRAQEGTLAADISTASRAGTLLGFDVGESDWPLKASFVLFMRNVIEQARTHRTYGTMGETRAGMPMRVTVPTSVKKVGVESPLGEKSELPVRGGLVVLPDIPHVGLYRLTWQGPQAGTLIVPANLTSEAESDVRAAPLLSGAEGEAEKVTIRPEGSLPDGHTEWAWVLALVALGFVIFDVWHLTRQPHVRVLAPAPAPKMPERKAA